ncbi:protein phosphatase 1, regulatory subunit [Trypanosoma conorhini]|uniref:Protein phosphatase 1, regulatory subunit n=1 Tax=Trypanosoma conorhini TaxID=83891 RepID=A0A3R7P6H9_9TRYP|nr:protein phosphatase 1, regulatory subunit [Trypanosoma conorhini]RNF13534.1 protein phosphatase 1, regulatory subunit [Trypanosoma conorhini]
MSQGVEHGAQEADFKAEKREKLRRGLEALFAAENTGTHNDSDEDSADEGRPSVGNERRGSSAVAETILNIDTTSEIIEVNNIRLFSLDELELDKLTNCVSLSLRKNLIHELTPFPEELAARLEELDLFDNKVRKVRNFFQL